MSVVRSKNKQTRGTERSARHPACALEPLESRTLLSTGTASALPPPASPTNVITIDVMALYTPAAMDAAGGADQMQAQIAQDVADANTVFSNSDIYINLRLAYSTEVNYTENNNLSTDLTRLHDPNDGYLDSIPSPGGPLEALASVRQATKADLVTLYTDPAIPVYGGLSYTMVDATRTDNYDWGLSVIVMPPKGPRYGLAHELGHNLGAQHDLAHASASGAFTYSHGYAFPSDAPIYRDIMAYGPQIVVPYFSNPYVFYNGFATGDPGTADNARTLNQTAPIVSAYSLPNLATFRPAGWPGATLVTNTAGATTASNAIYDNQTVYVTCAETGRQVAADSQTTLSVDGLPLRSWTAPAVQLNANSYVTKQVAVGQLKPGSHTLTLKVDSGNAIQESSETDNVFTQTINVINHRDLPPSASLIANSAITYRGRWAYKFKITYHDDRGVAVQSLGNKNVTVNGPRHYSAKATLVSVKRNHNGTLVTATYAIPAPGGAWDPADNGSYSIKLLPHQVADNAGHFAAQHMLGTVRVNISKGQAVAPKCAAAEPRVALLGPPAEKALPRLHQALGLGLRPNGPNGR